MITFTLEKPTGFTLAAASDFYAGFTPGSGMAAAAVDQLTLAFRVDRSFEAVAVSLHERGGELVAEMAGSEDEKAVRAQLGRVLGLEADAEAWQALGERVPLVGQLKAEFPGFFTAAKPSPYDAAVWSVIAPRISMTVAARIKMDIARAHGTAVELHGRTHHVFPAPRELLALEQIPGLNEEKVARLRGVAVAALEGLLDAENLRAMGEVNALQRLQSLRGIGPWSAGHIYHRGAAPIDALPLTEPRALHGFAHASGRPRRGGHSACGSRCCSRVTWRGRTAGARPSWPESAPPPGEPSHVISRSACPREARLAGERAVVRAPARRRACPAARRRYRRSPRKARCRRRGNAGP
jgi:DNA-3-methyladenine glycosylase II